MELGQQIGLWLNNNKWFSIPFGLIIIIGVYLLTKYDDKIFRWIIKINE